MGEYSADAGADGQSDGRDSLLVKIIESTADAVISETLDGVITSWNYGAVHMYGYTPGEMLGHNMHELVPPDRAWALRPIHECVRRGMPVKCFETRHLRKDGTGIDVSISVSPIRDASGNVTGAATVARDVTERNEAEAARQLSEAKRRQAERLSALGRLASGIAHDFNDLLSAIFGYARRVADATADDPTAHADAEEIGAAAQRAAELTKELLTFGRRGPTAADVADLNATIASLRPLLSATAGERISLTVEPAPDLPGVHADPERLAELLVNLVTNARDAMPRGGSVIIRTRVTELGVGHPHLQASVDPGRFVELTLSDTGAGMSPEDVDRIFEPFFVAKPLGGGLGLGLSAVYGIVAEAGGCISVDSAEGAGTTFHLYFPAAASPPPAPSSELASGGTAGVVAGPSGHGETVLVVDDDPVVLDVTSRILRQHGYSALTAGTWQDALSLTSSQQPDLVLTSSVMPGMSGEVFAEHLHEVKPGLPVLQMSGHGAAPPDARAQAGGPQRVLTKPFTVEALLAQLHALLSSGR